MDPPIGSIEVSVVDVPGTAVNDSLATDRGLTGPVDSGIGFAMKPGVFAAHALVYGLEKVVFAPEPFFEAVTAPGHTFDVHGQFQEPGVDPLTIAAEIDKLPHHIAIESNSQQNTLLEYRSFGDVIERIEGYVAGPRFFGDPPDPQMPSKPVNAARFIYGKVLGLPSHVMVTTPPDQIVNEHDDLTSRPVRRDTFGATIESQDPRLASALLAETILPTAENHVAVAREYRRLGLLDMAYARLNRAIQRDNRYAEAHEEMARIWRDWGLAAQALGSAYRAVYLEPRSASARNTLGTIFDALDKRDDARRSYEYAIALDPSASWALNNLCYSEFRSGHFREARARCEAAVQLAPKMAAAHNNLALTYAAMGDLDTARKEFLAAGDLASASFNLGIVHLAERDYLAAASAFEEAIAAREAYTAAKERARDARLRALAGTDE